MPRPPKVETIEGIKITTEDTTKGMILTPSVAFDYTGGKDTHFYIYASKTIEDILKTLPPEDLKKKAKDETKEKKIEEEFYESIKIDIVLEENWRTPGQCKKKHMATKKYSDIKDKKLGKVLSDVGIKELGSRDKVTIILKK